MWVIPMYGRCMLEAEIRSFFDELDRDTCEGTSPSTQAHRKEG